PHPAKAPRCSGVRVELPEGVSAYEGYAPGLHVHYGDAWDVRITRGEMSAFSPDCTDAVSTGTSCCPACRRLRHLPQFESVQKHILKPARKKSHLKYHTYAGL
ncbi:hypothetical protein GGX14DRAFT_313732, partial [Mycena pura]